MTDRREQVYAGNLTVDGEPLYGEVWVTGTAAVVFTTPDARVQVALHAIELAIDGDDHLTIDGLTEDDAAVHVIATAPEQPLGIWTDAKVTWTDGEVWAKATIDQTNYRVTVKLRGKTTRVLAGASMRTAGLEAVILLADGTEVSVALPVRSGCCTAR